MWHVFDSRLSVLLQEKAMTRKRGKVSATTGIQEDLSEQQQPPPLTEGLPEVDLD